MTEQYFAREPKVAHRRASISLSLRGITLDLITDAGVFSRDGVDPGSLLLMRSVEPPAEGAILDLGCGYGPIGLYYAARAPRCTVHLSDVNERAVALSRENAARNRLTNVQVHAGPGLAPLAGLVLDMIVTNPPIRQGGASCWSCSATLMIIYERAASWPLWR